MRWTNHPTYPTREATRFSFSSEPIDPSENERAAPIIPITVLSGFLGSGKTTLLQHMLNNNEGLKIAVIVNDVASVNIDSKLVRGQSTGGFSESNVDSLEDASRNFSPATPAGIVELQNGCACCSLSGELLTSVSELLTLSDLRHDDEKFDHIVVEMSGAYSANAFVLFVTET
jgi:G3E family GTPase